MADEYRIRPAQAAELPRLNQIERAAAARFAKVGLSAVAAMEPLSLDLLRAQQVCGRVWAAADSHDRAVGFAVVTVVDGAAHLEEVSVHPDHGRRGLGTRLVQVVCRWAGEQGYPAVTLSTFRDVPWNAPFYTRLGFKILDEQELGPGLLAVRDHEAQDGLDVQARVFMRKNLTENPQVSRVSSEPII